MHRVRSKTNLSRENGYALGRIADTTLRVYCKQQSCSRCVEYRVLHGRDTAYNQYAVARITERAKFQDGCCVCTSWPIIPALFRQTRTEACIPGDFLWDPRYTPSFSTFASSILGSLTNSRCSIFA